MEKAVYIGFSSPKKFKLGAEAIKLWQNRPYSHTYIRFESENILSSVYHAANGMVHFKSYENFLLSNNVIKEYCLNITDNQRIAAINHCIRLASEKYDYWDLFKILVVDVGIYFGIDVSTYDGKGYVCSELVGVFLIEQMGYKFNMPTHLLKPTDIDTKLQEQQKV